MTDISPGPGWWLAADGKWYPPETQSDVQALQNSNTAELRCRNCGNANTAGSQFCEQCGQPLGVTAANEVSTVPLMRSGGPSNGPRGSTIAATGSLRPVPIIPGTKIALSEGEHLLRAYPLVHFRPFRNKANAKLFVTDSRVILYSTASKLSGRVMTMEDIRIETIKGMVGFIDRGLNGFGTLLFGLAILASIFALIKIIIVGILLLAFLALIYLISYHWGRLGLTFYTQQVNEGAINFGYHNNSRIARLLGPFTAIVRMIFGVNSQEVLECFPERNAEDIIAEVSALVFDLNRLGTIQGTQWDTGL
jgi:hypothetical protein